MRDEHADVCKCPRGLGIGNNVVRLKRRRRNQIEGQKDHLEFQSQQVRLDAMFARINPTC
jgi:hypothetical protein